MSRHGVSSSNGTPRRAAYPAESARALSKLSADLRSSFGFTKTEAVVAALLARGLAYSEIAEKLQVSYNTVHTHTKAIHKKADVPTTGRLTALIYGTERRSK
jgi:DNA-binding CsgD family transcriptional regulator